MPDPSPRFSFLTDHAVIAVSGGDARTFLHAQLTQNINDLPADRTALAAWADARGRVRAIFHVVPDGERWLLVTSADIVATLLPKLRMFVLRADVALVHAPELAVAAIVGDARAWLAGENIPLDSIPNALAHAAGIAWLRVGRELIYAIGPADAIRNACRLLTESPASDAELAAIRAGLPVIAAAESERYTPHMLNLDRLGAISFDKGCYPGQEIVARTQNLGAVKRRVRRFIAQQSQVPARGSALLDDKGGHAGEVLRAAPAESGIELLAVVPVDARALTLEGSRDGQLVALD
jgi:folate-binding protein YgfZ